MKSLLKTVALITLFSVLTRIVGFLFRIYLSRAIGPEALGLYQIAFSVFIVILTTVSSGIPFIISRITASIGGKNQKIEKGKLVSSSLIMSFCLSVLVCLFVFVFQRLFANIFTEESCLQILLTLLPAVVFSSIYSVFRGVLWGEDNYFALCVSEFFEQVVRIFICGIILTTTLSALESAVSVAWSLTIACFLSAVFVTLLYFCYGGRLFKPSKIYKRVLKESSPITGVRMIGSLIQPLIALIIPFRLVAMGYTKVQAMVLYGVTLGMTFPLLFIPTMLIGSLSTALVPDISSAMAENNTKHIEKRIKSSMNFTLFISCFFVPLFLGVGDIIGVFLFDNALSGTLLQYSAWVMIPMGLTNITSSILNSMGMEIKSCINYFFGAIALFLCIWFLPVIVGINAFAIGMGISMSITSILNIIMLEKKTQLKIEIWKPLSKFLAILIPCSAITAFTGAILNNFIPAFFTLAISCSLGGLFFICLSLIFNLVEKRNFGKIGTMFSNSKLKLKKKMFKMEK